MSRKQRLAVGVPLLLFLSMLAVYRLLARRLGTRRAWYAGFIVYWSVWGISFPLGLLGFRDLKALFAYRRPRALGWILLIVPPLFALAGRPTADQPRRGHKEKVALVCTALMNGICEEVLWRGVYVALFPNNPWWSVVWPALWFALWHYAPGSVSPLTEVRTLMVGAGVYGALLGWLAYQTRSLLWPVTSHTLAGLVQALR